VKNRSVETRLAKLEERQPSKDRLVFQVIDNEAEVARLEVLHPDALVIHRTLVSPPDAVEVYTGVPRSQDGWIAGQPESRVLI
jgi:hypothetical protein